MKKTLKNGSTHLILTANGPGEISGWVRPIVDEVRRQNMDWRISLVLWPYLYASGAEQKIASCIPGIDKVIGVGKSMNLILGDGIQKDLKETGSRHALLHLGGNIILTLLLSKRLGCPAFVYSEKPENWHGNFFDKVFLSNKNARDGNSVNRRYKVTGNLFADSVLPPDAVIRHSEKNIQNASVTIGFFPGSRPYIMKEMLPFFLRIAKDVAQRIHDVKFVIAKSDFISSDELFLALTGEKNFCFQKEILSVKRAKNYILVKMDGIEIQVVSSHEAFNQADFLVMVPGTCTAEAMLRGLPMIVVAPYIKLESVKFPGAAGLIDRFFPTFGNFLKKRLLIVKINRTPYLSYPNLKANMEVVPEFRGEISTSHVAVTVAKMAIDAQWRGRIKEHLNELAELPGAASLIIEEMNLFLKVRASDG